MDGNQVPSWDECFEILERLPSMPPDNRVEALERLVRNPSPGIREQALRLGANLLPDSRITEYLRDSADAALRNAGSEILRLRGGRSLPVVVALLQDSDADVVLQAVLILDRLRDPRALEPLHAVLGHSDPNVQQEAVLAIGRLGDARSIPHLMPFLSADFWVQMAAVQALGDLRSPEAVPHLAAKLTDPLVGSLAAEALARIGGEDAFRSLAAHWPAGGIEIDDETMLGLLAHTLEGLPRPEELAALPGGFREALSARLHDRSAEVRAAAARCLLALGPNPWDSQAIETLAAALPSSPSRPACLARRFDLIGPLLVTSEGPARAWGFQLAARYPAEVPRETFLDAMRWVAEHGDLPPALLEALKTVQMPELGAALLDVYLHLPPGEREPLTPALEINGADVRAALEERQGIEDSDRLVLSALLGRPIDEVVEAIQDLEPPLRPGVVSRLMRLEGLIPLLPWDDWLTEAPELYGALAAEAAVRCEFRELLPALRQRADAMPSVPLLRALGALGDREAVPVLIRNLREKDELRQAALEGLGRIGGPEARAALRETARGLGLAPEARVAYKALAGCAGPEDDALFRGAVDHPDWQVRLAAAEALGRFSGLENVAVLTRLASDTVPAVAHRALAALDN